MRFTQIVIIVLLLVITGISAYGIMQAGELKKVELKNKAIDACGTMAIEVKKGQFIPYIYTLCLKDKEIKSQTNFK